MKSNSTTSDREFFKYCVNDLEIQDRANKILDEFDNLKLEFDKQVDLEEALNDLEDIYYKSDNLSKEDILDEIYNIMRRY